MSPSSLSRDYITFGIPLPNKNEKLCCNLTLCLVKRFKCWGKKNFFILILEKWKILELYEST